MQLSIKRQAEYHKAQINKDYYNSIQRIQLSISKSKEAKGAKEGNKKEEAKTKDSKDSGQKKHKNGHKSPSLQKKEDYRTLTSSGKQLKPEKIEQFIKPKAAVLPQKTIEVSEFDLQSLVGNNELKRANSKKITNDAVSANSFEFTGNRRSTTRSQFMRFKERLGSKGSASSGLLSQYDSPTKSIKKDIRIPLEPSLSEKSESVNVVNTPMTIRKKFEDRKVMAKSNSQGVRFKSLEYIKNMNKGQQVSFRSKNSGIDNPKTARKSQFNKKLTNLQIRGYFEVSSSESEDEQSQQIPLPEVKNPSINLKAVPKPDWTTKLKDLQGVKKDLDKYKKNPTTTKTLESLINAKEFNRFFSPKTKYQYSTSYIHKLLSVAKSPSHPTRSPLLITQSPLSPFTANPQFNKPEESSPDLKPQNLFTSKIPKQGSRNSDLFSSKTLKVLPLSPSHPSKNPYSQLAQSKPTLSPKTRCLFISPTGQK